jgi:AcrR family transcriptional regulator
MPKPTAPRERWIEAGMRALADGGVAAVRVEVLAKTLGVTKGSFYWQLSDRQALLEAMLDAWETTYVDDVIRQVESVGGDGRARLRDLFELAEAGAPELLRLDLAIREWARQDSAVMHRLIRVDNRRMDYMRALFADFSRDAAEAEERSLLAFCVWIGQPLVAAEHPGRSRGDVVRAALELILR